MNLYEILWRNSGQVLTPELIVGILHGAAAPATEDNTLLSKLGPSEQKCGDVTFQIELLADCLDEVKQHHIDQWNEVERARQDLNPDYDTVLRKEREGFYLLFTARKDGKLVGNTGCYLYKSMHNQKLAAKEDTMYLAPEARKGFTAVRFFKYCEKQLLRTGVEEITISVKTTNSVYKLWERQGYEWTDRVYTKTFEVK